MKEKKGFRKLLSLAISASLLLTGIPAAMAQTEGGAKDAPYTLTFDTDDVSNWEQAHGQSVYSVVDGRLSVETADGNESNYNPQYAMIYDKNSPAIQDGELSANINANDKGRFGLVFRYRDKDNYDFVGYDYGGAGAWAIKHRVNGQETTTLFTGPFDPSNQTFDLKAEFFGSELTVSINNAVCYTGAVLEEGQAGKLGVRTWGYSGNYAKITLDNVSYIKKNAPEKDENGNYLVTFTDATKRGGWQVASGYMQGMTFTDGAGDAGYMTVKAGPEGTDNGNTISFDSTSPTIGNGFLECDVTNNGSDRIGFLFRYQSAAKFAGIAYDATNGETGTWNWITADGWGSITSSGPALKQGVKHHIRIEYVDDNIRLLVDGRQAFQRTISELDVGQGKIGLRSWGYSTLLSNANYDNFVSGKFNAVLLEPSTKYVARADVGTYDIPVTLSQTENALVKLTANGADLVADEDYTVSGATVTLKKEYVSKVQSNGDTTINFIFADGFIAPFLLQIQPDPDSDVTYLRDFSQGIEGFTLKSGTATVDADAQKGTASITNGQNAFVIDDNSPELRNSEVEFVFTPKNSNGNFAAVLRYIDENHWVAVGPKGTGNHTNWYIFTSNGDEISVEEYGDGQRLMHDRVVPYTVKVRLEENVVTCYLDNAEIFSKQVNNLPNGAGKTGLRYNENAGADVEYLSINTCNPLVPESGAVTEKTIRSDAMTVAVDQAFPRVIRYTMDGKSLSGQEKAYYVVELNNKRYVPTVTGEFTANSATYHMSVEVAQGKTVTFDVVLSVEGNVLSFDIKKIDDSAHTVRTINFPNQSLVSMSSAAGNAKLRADNYLDAEIQLDLTTQSAQDTHSNTTIAVLSSDELAASVNCGSPKSRQEINYQTMVNGDHTTTGLWPNEFLYKGLDGDIMQGSTWAKVAIAGDRNKDGKVDFQDGAIALRDDIPTVRLGSDIVQDSYTMVVMDVGSVVQYPFLRVLDNIKKLNLGMDGFAQNLIIKGYQTEGHDSSHPDFAAISKRAGGVEDFQTLIENAGLYNTTLGVHINETEAYPEAPQYGALTKSNMGGWPWYDQALLLNQENDLLEAYRSQIPGGNMDDRLAALKSITKTKTNDLSTVYVDTYFATRWPAYRISQKLNDNGWALTTEYAYEFTKNSVLCHHLSGNFNNSGNLVRFVNNGTQEIFNGGNGLFRMPSDHTFTGIYGWQFDNGYGQNYSKTIEHFFTQVLPNKYLANFPINQWEDNTQAKFGSDNQVVSKMVDNVNQITKDGKLVANGNNIFIPWDPQTEEKIYHWNATGGQTTWDLPDSWNGLQNVKLYTLTDEGRTNETVLNVANGQVTIDAQAKTGYVLYKGDAAIPAQTDMTALNWGQGSPVRDMGFDSHTWGYAWEKTSTAANTNHIVFTNDNATTLGKGNTNALIQGANGADGEIVQTMTNLKPGQTYSASVFVDVSGRTAELSVTTPGGKTVSVDVDKTYLPYNSTHSDKKASNYQRIKLTFTQPAIYTTATIRLSAAAGSADSYVHFDDVRVTPVDVSDYGNFYFIEDFENVDQGFGPFEGGNMVDTSHLSEKSDFTQDVIDGRYSLKIRTNIMRTLPHRLPFLAGATYTVSLDYLSNNSTFTVAAKDGNGTVLNSQTLDQTGMGTVNKKTVQFTFKAPDNDNDCYLEIGESGDLIVDNLLVRFTYIDKALQALVNKAETYKAEAYTEATFTSFTTKLNEAKALLTNGSEAEMEKAYHDLQAAMDALSPLAKAGDKQLLQNAVEAATPENENEFIHDETWQKLQDLLAEAESMKNQNVAASDVSKLIDDIANTFEKLTPNDKEDTEAPSTPTNVKASGIGSNKATISWDASTDNVGVAEYRVSLNGTFVQEVNALSIELTGLTPETEYTVSIVAVDAAGNESISANASFTTLKTGEPEPDAEAPTAPSNVKASGIGSGKATISWDASTDNVGVAAYRVFLNDTMVQEVSTLSVELTGLTPETEYTVSVAAVDAAGNVSDSAQVVFTTLKAGDPEPEPDTEAPTAPSNVKASSIGSDKATISWEASTDNVGVAAYRVFLNGTLFKEVSTLSVELTSLLPETEYTVTVAAVDAAGNVSSTAQVIFTTLKGSDPGPDKDTEAPTAPTGLRAENIDTETAILSWDASTDNVGVTGYAVYYNGEKLGTSIETTLTVQNLAPGTEYTFEVRAYDAAGNLSEPASVTFTTKEKTDTNSSSSSSSGKPGISGPGTTPSTGDSSPFPLLILFGVSLGAAAYLKRKQRSSKI